MDRTELERLVTGLRAQVRMERLPVSKAAAELRQYTEVHGGEDPFVNPMDKRDNPWVEKSKCALL